MATPLSASTVLTSLRDEGLTVVEVGNWRTHNRNHKGAWGPVHGIMIHHTVTSGSASTVRICRDGFSGLPGPLCHGVITKDGRVHLVGHGRANHAGLGDDDVLTAVIAEKALPRPNENNTDGNARFYGFECENLGDGRDPWPTVQREAVARAAAALCRKHGWNEKSVIGHAEWTNTKIDPRGPGENATAFMTALRGRVRELLSGQPGDPPQEDTMPDYLSLGMTKPFPLDPGTWVSLTWDTEWSDAAGQHAPGAQTFASGVHYTGSVHLQADGVTPGAEIQLRLAEDDDKGKKQRDLRIAEGHGTSGGTYVSTSITGTVTKSNRLKLRVCHYDDQPITVTRVEIKLLTWKR